MNLIPTAITRKVAEQVLLSRKHSPSILFGAGIVCMVGSTVMAARATLKLEDTLDIIESNKIKAEMVKKQVEDGAEGTEGVTYSDGEYQRDLTIIVSRGVISIVKLYAPAVILGGLGVLCLTKSHKILTERNAALTAAYVAVDAAFKQYRARVADRYGEEIDRNLMYDSEEVDVIDEETGKITTQTRILPGEPSGYARWFDEENASWNQPAFMNHNWMFLRTQQNWANDMLRSRGHMFLNEVYAMVGLSHTSAGAIVGWVYDRNNDRGDNYIDFGCWDQKDASLPDEFFSNGRDAGILLDFNVDGPIWQMIDERNAQKQLES